MKRINTTLAAGLGALLAVNAPAQDTGGESQPTLREAGHRLGEMSPAWRVAIRSRAEHFLPPIDAPDPLTLVPPVESFFFPDPESVCAPDERTRIDGTDTPPWSANCRLIITFQDGSRAVGTGWLLGPRLVVTAGHCVHEGLDGDFYKSVEVIPGANADERPFGSQVSTELRAAPRWKAAGSIADDYGAILLERPFVHNGTSPALHETRVATNEELRVGEAHLAGYPADKTAATQWTDRDPISHTLPTRLRYRIDTYGGQSGSAVIHDGKAVAIHNYGGCPNSSSRITTEVERQLRTWLEESNR